MKRILVSLSPIVAIWLLWAFVSYDLMGPLYNETARMIFAFASLWSILFIYTYPGWKE